MKFLFLYWNTIRYLKPVQVFGRIWFILRKPKGIKQIPHETSLPNGKWCSAPTKEKSMSDLQVFNFLNVERKLKDITWQAPEMSKLWRYNLHYFDYLNSEPGNSNNEKYHFLLSDWIVKNVQFQGDAWDPYPTSLRIVNWIKWSIQGNELNSACRESLAIQSSWLSKRLEKHMKGNHLLANAKALIFAGLYFKGQGANKWFHMGCEILEEEVEEQILQDGGHFEKSTMYHAVVLEDILDLLNILGFYKPCSYIEGGLSEKLRIKAAQMVTWLKSMTHPNGEISYFNDANLGSCLNLSALYNYAKNLGIEEISHNQKDSIDLQYSGFCRMANDNFSALLDVGSIGASYLAGHAHADTLSFEMSLQEHRIIVNGGTSTYENNQQRLFERGTKSHSTVTLEDMDSSEVWGAFRVARRANIVDKACDMHGNPQTVRSSHNGYVNRLPGNPVHQRTWKLDGNELLVSDQVKSSSCNEGVARFILHPDIEINILKEGRLWSLEKGGKVLLKVEVIVGRGEMGKSTFAEAFGKIVTTLSIDVFLQAGRASTRFFY